MAIPATLFAAIGLAGRICLGLVFLLAGVQKIHHRRLLPGVIANYRLLPRWAVGPIAAVLPAMEVLLGVGLLVAPGQPWLMLAAIALLLLFAGAMAVNVMRGRTHIDCGCGQDFLSQHLDWSLVARNLMLAGLLVVSLAAAPVGGPYLAWMGAPAGLAFFLLYLLFNLFAALPKTGARRFA